MAFFGTSDYDVAIDAIGTDVGENISRFTHLVMLAMHLVLSDLTIQRSYNYTLLIFSEILEIRLFTRFVTYLVSNTCLGNHSNVVALNKRNQLDLS